MLPNLMQQFSKEYVITLNLGSYLGRILEYNQGKLNLSMKSEVYSFLSRNFICLLIYIVVVSSDVVVLP